MSERFVVTLARMDFNAATASCEIVVLGPFRTRGAADYRANVIRKLADQYEDNLTVVVEPLAGGQTSAQEALDRLYGVYA